MRALLTALAIATLAFASTVLAQPMIEIRGDKPLELRPDRAYLLFRTNSAGVSPVFLRIPSQSELKRYEAAKVEAFAKAEPRLIKERERAIARAAAPKGSGGGNAEPPPVPSLDNFNFVWEDIKNVVTVNIGRTFAKTDAERTMLVEAQPGTYVVYGLGFGNIFHTCLCLGTVSFPARVGRVTDLGTLLLGAAAEPSDVPELAGETGFGPSMNGHIATWAAAIRPAGTSATVPAALAGTIVKPADYRATGKFVAPFSFNINRLAPIPGVLGYDRGDVIDLVTNTVAENQY